MQVVKRLFIPFLAVVLGSTVEAKPIYLNCSETEVIKDSDSDFKQFRKDIPVFINTELGKAQRWGSDYRLAISPDHYTLVKYEESKENVGAISINSSRIYEVTIDRATLEYKSKYKYWSTTSGFVSGSRKSELITAGVCEISKPKAENKI